MEIFPGLEPVYPRCQSPESPSHRPGRVNIERAVSPTADPIPCALRDNLVEDCSHAKLVNWIWRKRQAASDLDPKQRNECPMPTCRQVFNDFHQMITHLQDCPEVVRGLYWCWDCYRTEEFSLCHCRSCKHTWTQSNSTLGNTMKKVTRALSNSLRRSLRGKRARKETSVPSVTPPNKTSELFGNAVPHLPPSIAPCDPYSRQQSSQPQPLASSDLWANFASLESIDTAAPQAPLAAYAAELPAELAHGPGFFFGHSPGQPMPSSSLSNVSLMSFHSPDQPPRGSLVSLASPRSSVGGSRILSPLSAHPATAGGAAHTPSPLTDSVFCESPTTMEDGGDPSKNFASWAPLHSSSWSSGDTYISPAGDFAEAQQTHFPELPGSLPETAGLHFQNNLASLESDSFLAESMRPGVKIPAPGGYELPAKEPAPEYVQAHGSRELCSSLSSDDRILSQVTQDSLASLSTALQDGTFEGTESMLGSNSPLDSDTFFQRAVPVVNDACEQSYRVNHDGAGYNGWSVNVMRHYDTDRSRQDTGSNEARQNSWSSSSSTTIGCNEPQDLLSAPAKPLLAELPDNTASRPTVRRHGGTITRHRARTVRKGTKKEVCPHCDYSAEGADRLKLVKRHMKIHQDTEDWFQCGFSSVDGSICNKGYNRRDNLRQHQRTEKHAHDGKEKRLLRKRLPGGPKYRPLIC